MTDLNCSYEFIQTPIPVWQEILTHFPIYNNDVFFEPFKGVGNLYNLVTNAQKEYCEIVEDIDIFNYDFLNSKVTKLYTNPPFKIKLTNKKGIQNYKNCVFYFLQLFMTKLPFLQEIGFLINAKSFQSITPKRLITLQKLGFFISNIVLLNIQQWYGLYYFVLFTKKHNDFVIPIFKYF